VLASARPFLTLAALLSLAACTGAEAPDGGAPAGDGAKAGKAKAKAEAPAYVPLQQAIEGAPAPAILLSQAWFLKDANGKPKPGPARLQVWRKGADGWQATLLEDGESNVFHKALATDAGLLTIAGEKAILKRWSHTAGAWSAETLWSKSWGGKFNRLRDIEVGDVDADGKDEVLLAEGDRLKVFAEGADQTWRLTSVATVGCESYDLEAWMKAGPPSLSEPVARRDLILDGRRLALQPASKDCEVSVKPPPR